MVGGRLVFDGVRAAGALPEAVQVGKELRVDEVAQIVPGKRGVVVELASLVLRCGPAIPAIGLVEEKRVFLAFELGLGCAVLVEAVDVFQEQQPRSLLGLVELRGAACLLSEDVVDVAKGLFEHSGEGSWCCGHRRITAARITRQQAFGRASACESALRTTGHTASAASTNFPPLY